VGGGSDGMKQGGIWGRGGVVVLFGGAGGGGGGGGGGCS